MLNTPADDKISFLPCPYCATFPSVREATEQERKLFPARRFRLSHQCDGLNCLLYGRSKQYLSYDWAKFIEPAVASHKNTKKP